MPDLTSDNAQAIVAAYEQRERLAADSVLDPAQAFAVRAAALGLEETGFDWQSWPPARSGEVSDARFIAQADPQTLERIMTTHMRMDRFVGGHLELMHEQGILGSVVERLRELLDAGAI